MTQGFVQDSLGGRIAAFRKARGFSSTNQLAAAIGEGKMSGAVLRNIESGRKGDLSVSQLLNIAWALEVSPLLLLAPLGRPADRLDLPNLVSSLEQTRVAQFDEWVSMHSQNRTGYATPQQYISHLIVEAIRRLATQVQQREATASELRTLHRIEVLVPKNAEPERVEELTDLWSRQAAAVDKLRAHLLEAFGVETEWASVEMAQARFDPET
ncbi:helix-turn-helix transcriptional regulator [Cryobacterium sp. TMT2-42-4]|uniref:helix-turn-helix domain-containing protein n=1 Tax=Cryobacterium sp. TMT2-42-4 TaxID=1259255 RepID=UPI00106B882A|nr:helix-turn-helix transcriptional regulator [Cryobacterium sp. TMT2-42-4]TFC37668.1 XRE family transcriptional regulator [Cryobacterium sp. TMT2-42-4]